MRTIYFDSAATTPIHERVLEAMLPYLKENFGNASSTHHLGQKAKVVVEDAREQIAAHINAEPSEVIFTSGGTESNNAIIKGVLSTKQAKTEILTSQLEHHAVLHPIEMAKLKGFRPVFAQPKADGVVSADNVAKKLSGDTALVSLMQVNNEIGCINPVKEIATLCRQKGVPYHTDAVQSLGKVPLDVKDMDVDFLSGSAHKIYGPKGVGMMYVRNGAPWMPWLTGGSQERLRRGGTTNVPGVIGFAKALEISVAEMELNTAHYIELRSFLLQQLDKQLTACTYRINGSKSRGIPHIINMSFMDADGLGIDGEMLLLNLDIEGICVSNGSACTSGAVEPSHVLSGLGMSESVAKSSIRVSFGRTNTKEDVLYFVEKLNAVLTRMFNIAR